MNSTESVVFEHDGPVATLTLNRPEAGNALDLDMAKSFLRAAIRCDEDTSIRSVILTGAGRFFCVGGDLGVFAATGDRFSALLKELTAYLHMGIARLAGMQKPLVTAVNGPAAGAGLSLAILGDVVLAGRSSHFSLSYATVGLSPDAGSTWLLPRLIGLRRTQEMAFLNRRLTSEEADRYGLITRLVEDSQVREQALAMALQMATSATAALGRTRLLLQSSFGATFESQLEAEARSIAELARGSSALEGVNAFLAKRKPVFPTGT